MQGIEAELDAGVADIDSQKELPPLSTELTMAFSRGPNQYRPHACSRLIVCSVYPLGQA